MIKNLKIFKKCKNFKLIKTSIITTVSLFLTSCTGINVNINSDKKNDENSSTIYSEYSGSSTYDITSSEIVIKQNYGNIDVKVTEDADNYMNKTIEFDLDEVNSFVDKIDDIYIDFKHSDLYYIDENINKYNERKIIELDSNYESRYLTNSTLINKIKENNKKYLSETSSTKYSEISEQKLTEICNYILESWNYEIQNNSINVNELDKIIESLTILQYSDFAYAFYDQSTNMIGVNFNSISTIDESNSLKRLIIHESKHVLQSLNNKYDNDCKNKFGINIKWEDIEVNSLYNEWFFEASAEALTNNQIGLDGKNLYKNGLDTLEIIKTSSILSTNNNIDSLEKLTFQDDLEKLFEYFDCNTLDQKKEIIETFFAYNVINTTNPDSTVTEFYDAYQKKNLKKMDFMEKSDYSDELKINTAEVLTKVFYKNLAKYIQENKISLKECFSLIEIFEIQLNKQCKYYDETKIDYTNQLFETYNDVQGKLFELIGDKLNIKSTKVNELYNSFYISEDTDKFYFSNLTDSKKTYYEELIESNSYFKSYPMNSYYDLYFRNSKLMS